MTYFLAVLVLLLAVLVVGRFLRVRDLEREQAFTVGRLAHAEFEVARLTQHAEDLLVPLTWTWDAVETLAETTTQVPPHSGDTVRLRHYLLACFQEIQKTLLQDDVEMTETMAEARSATPPRRLPRYPQTPPYLARPEDVAGVAAIQAPRLTDVEAAKIEADWRALPKHGFDVVNAQRVLAAEAHHGAPPRFLDATRYFVRYRDAQWTEVGPDAHQAARFDAAVAETYLVDPFAGSGPMPRGVRDLIFGA